MGLWKRIKENRLERAAKVRGGRKSEIRPESVLVWIDAAYNDAATRTVRGLAIAEAFHLAGIANVSLACLSGGNLPGEAKKRGVQWIDSRPDGNPITLNEIIKTANADLVIADSASAPRLQMDLKVPLFVLLTDTFSPNLLESDSIHNLLLPGLLVPPDFETLRLLPSRVGDCIHGMEYVSVPSEYRNQANEIEEDRILIALSGPVSSETLSGLLDTVKRSWDKGATVLADATPAAAEQLQAIQSANVTVLIDPPLPERLAAIRRAKLVLAYPSLMVYEFFALHKPVILMPRNEQETLICRLALEQKIARTVPAGESAEVLTQCIEDLLRNEESGKNLSSRLRELMPSDGAGNTADALSARFDRTGGRQKTV